MDGTIVKKDNSFQVSWKKLVLIKLVALRKTMRYLKYLIPAILWKGY